MCFSNNFPHYYDLLEFIQFLIVKYLGIPVDRCLWRKNGRIVNLFAEKYELVGRKSDGDCSVRLKNAFRQNTGHYECSAEVSDSGLLRPRRNSGLDLSKGIFIDVLCK